MSNGGHWQCRWTTAATSPPVVPRFCPCVPFCCSLYLCFSLFTIRPYNWRVSYNCPIPLVTKAWVKLLLRKGQPVVAPMVEVPLGMPALRKLSRQGIAVS